MMKTIKDVYANHQELPYIAPKYAEELLEKPIPKRNMERTAEGLLPGHIIMLWRIQFGTYRTDSPHHKYFYTTYGIDAQKELDWLMKTGYVGLESPTESLRHLSATQIKSFLKARDVKGLSKFKRSELDQCLLETVTESELAALFSVRGYFLTTKGQKILAAHPEIVAKHPKKKL